MSTKISRRKMIGAGMTAAILAGAGQTQAETIKESGPGRSQFWMPGPDKNLKKDLKPGNTTVRLAGYLSFEPGENIGENVRKLRESGITSGIASADQWINAKDSDIRELKDALKQHDVNIFEVGGYRNLIHTDEKMRREYQKRIALCLEAADKIGCPMVGTISGSRNPDGNEFIDNYAVHPDNWTLETWKLLIQSIRTILKDTSGMKSVIGMEAQVTTNLDGPLAHKNLMEDVGDPRVKVNLDPTNMVHLHNYFHTTELVNQCFDILGENIFGCHAKDTFIFTHTQTVHVQEVCPGRGNMDYETYLIRMSKMKWSRSLLPEHFPAEQMPEAYAYIRKVAEKVGVKIHG